MRADRHHATTVGSLCVEDIKIILHILQIGGVRRGRRIKAHDVIITDCVGDDGKGLASTVTVNGSSRLMSSMW